MIVNSHNIEFGYELISTIPYANWLASKGILHKTISGNDTNCLYFFSPHHEINTQQRNYFNIKKCDTPNIHIHNSELDTNKFLPPNYKKQYANKEYQFDKETIVICNRHNTEWATKPINFFDLPTLKALFELLQDNYQIVYINVEGRPELYDNAPPEPLGDFELLKQYPKVINIHDIKTKYSFNELQLRIFANCSKFITMNGGHAILASYFGGENFIMSKYGDPQASEIKEKVNSFYRWYDKFGGQRVIHVPNEKTLIERVKDSWIDCNPIVNVLVRTSSRPRFFDKCIKSILNQTYKNINIFVSIDQKNWDYTVKYPIYPVFVKKQHEFTPPMNSPEYGKTVPYNLYLNDLTAKVKEGLIVYLDDDDQYTHEKSIETFVNEYKNGSELIFWQVKIEDRIIPNDDNFGNAPYLFQLSGIGFAFDAKYKHLAVWTPYKRGDFRVADALHKAIEKKGYIKEILSEAQEGPHFGSPIDARVELIENIMEAKITVKIISNKYRGKVMPFNIGDIKTYPESTAKGLIINGIAKVYYKDDLQPEVELVAPEKPAYIPEMTKKEVVKRGPKSMK